MYRNTSLPLKLQQRVLPKPLLTPRDIDYLPNTDQATKLELQGQIQKLWLLHRAENIRNAIQALKDLETLCASVLDLVQPAISPELDELEERLDDCWQGYLELGAKYFLNTSVELWSSDHAHYIHKHHRVNLRFTYESVVNAQLIHFASIRTNFPAIEKHLKNGQLEAMDLAIRRLRHSVDESEVFLAHIQLGYEELFAARNALLADNKIPAVDRFEAEREAMFKFGGDMVAEYACRIPRDYLAFASEMGWTEQAN